MLIHSNEHHENQDRYQICSQQFMPFEGKENLNLHKEKEEEGCEISPPPTKWKTN